MITTVAPDTSIRPFVPAPTGSGTARANTSRLLATAPATTLAASRADKGDKSLPYFTRAKPFNLEVRSGSRDPVKITVTEGEGVPRVLRFPSGGRTANWKNIQGSGGKQWRVLVETAGERIWLGTNPDGTLKTSTFGWKAEWSSDWTTLRIFRQTPSNTTDSQVQTLVKAAARGDRNAMLAIENGALSGLSDKLAKRWFSDKLVTDLFKGKPEMPKANFIRALKHQNDRRAANITAALEAKFETLKARLDPFDLVIPALGGSGATMDYAQQYFGAVKDKVITINDQMLTVLRLADTAAKTGNLDAGMKNSLLKSFADWREKFNGYMTKHASNLEKLKAQHGKWKRTEAKQRTFAIVQSALAGFAALGSIGFGMANAAAVVGQAGAAASAPRKIIDNLVKVAGNLRASVGTTNFPALLGSFTLFTNNATTTTIGGLLAKYFNDKVEAKYESSFKSIGETFDEINRWLLQSIPPSETYSMDEAKKKFGFDKNTDPNKHLGQGKYGYWKRYTDKGLFGTSVARTHYWKLHILDLTKV